MSTNEISSARKSYDIDIWNSHEKTRTNKSKQKMHTHTHTSSRLTFIVSGIAAEKLLYVVVLIVAPVVNDDTNDGATRREKIEEIII
jgi:hypothetical protein